ncbi:MAG: hypothetical protein HY908_02540, partial [Myxococcales bacterium]|nr:hypothetical protein [Myxococcales bacterium]
MAGATRSNHPRGQKPADKVQRLQVRLGDAAKLHPERRFHALYDRIARRDVLAEAWKRVRRNKGAAGVDNETLAALEEHGVEHFLEELRDVLLAGRYRPAAVLRRYIPKADGKKRPLGIPTVRDRVVQMAAKLVLEPIFEAGFRASSYGFRPGRSATMALETLRKLGAKGYNHVLDADIGGGCGPCASSAPARSCTLDRPSGGRATTSSRVSGSTACGAPSATRRRRNAASRETTGKPCAGNPHARFE